jgi:hypothetical protein
MSQTKAQLLAPIGIITCPGLDVTVGGSSPFQVGSTGIITAVSASFSGNVTVGGTLTYDDVTNIDSVGLITARSGINVTSGIITASSDGINASSNLILKTGGTERARITSDGKFGINQTVPTEDLEVKGDQTATIYINSGQHDAGTAQEATLKLGFNQSHANDSIGYVKLVEAAGNSYDGRLLFGVPYNNGGTPATREVLRIDQAGQIGFSSTNYGSSGQVLTSGGASAAPTWSTPASGGLTEYDQWIVTVNTNSGSNINGWQDDQPWGGTTTPATVSLARVTTSQNPLFAKLGTGVAKDSNGYFSFPSTGYWEVKFTAYFQAQYQLRNTYAVIRATSDGGSSWNKIAEGIGRSPASSNQIANIQPVTVLVNITNTTNDKVYFSCYIEDGGVVRGENDRIQSNMVFKKVA